MSSISAGTTSGTALVSTGDTTGTLDLKTGASATTALSIDASQNITFTNQPTYTGGTANGVLYLNGSKVATSGSALVFDGTNLGIGTSSPGAKLDVANNGVSQIAIRNTSGTTKNTQLIYADSGGNKWQVGMDVATNNGSTIFQWYYAPNATSYLNLDSSGNLGLGVTPSAWSTGKALELGFLGNALWGNAADEVIVSQNAYYNSGWKYATSRKATHYSQYDAQHRWFTAGSGTAGNAISWTQAMTLDASGNLLVGTTSSASGKKAIIVGSTAASSSLWLGNTNAVGSSNAFNAIYFGNGTNGQDRAIRIESYQDGAYSDIIGMRFFTQVSDAGGPIERARFDSSGNLLVGTTNSDPTFNRVNGSVLVHNGSILCRNSGGSDFGTSGSSGTHIYFYTDNGSARVSAGNIASSGSTTTYNTSSDYRLKNITGPVTNSGAYIDSLNPVEGTWKADGSPFVGLIAHEVQEVSRTQVATGEKDGEKMQSMDYSSAEIIANLIAEVKSLRARIAALESK